MDHTYDLSGLEARHNSISMARSMRVAKQDRLERDEKPQKQRKRALVAVCALSIYLDDLVTSNL